MTAGAATGMATLQRRGDRALCLSAYPLNITTSALFRATVQLRPSGCSGRTVAGGPVHTLPDALVRCTDRPEWQVPAKVKDAIPEAIDQLLRYSETARGQGGRERAALLLQPIRGGDLPAGSQVRHHHHAHREVLLPLGRPVSTNRGRTGPRRGQPPTTSNDSSPACSTGTTCSTLFNPTRCSRRTIRARRSRSSAATNSSAQ